MAYELLSLSDQDWQLVTAQRGITKDINARIVRVAVAELKPKSKRPVADEWNKNLAHLDTDLQAWIDVEELKCANFGYILVEGWIDVDIDATDVEFKRCVKSSFDRFGIDTRLAFGRLSVKFPSHFFVQLVEADYENFEDLVSFMPRGVKLNGHGGKVEVRTSIASQKTKGVKQTVVPGSIYEGQTDIRLNDPSVWYNAKNEPATSMRDIIQTTPSRVQFRDLIKAIGFAYILYLVKDSWLEGTRQNNALNLFGLLARELIKHEAIGQNDALNSHVMCLFEDEADVFRLIEFICAQCGDDEVSMRKDTFSSALFKLRNNPGEARVPGWPKVAACFGSEVAVGLRLAFRTGLNISPIEEYEERYIYDLSGNMYIDLEAKVNGWGQYVFNSRELTERHADEWLLINGKPREAFKLFQRSNLRIKVADRDLMPDQDPNQIVQISTTGGIVDSDFGGNSRLCFNTFSGFIIKPATQINAKLMEQCHYYFDRLLGYLTRDNANQMLWIKKWLAYTLRHPGDKQQISLVMVGGQGTGKSFFGETFLQALFGSLHSLASSRILSGDFGIEPVIDKIMVFVDEANFFEDGAIDAVKKLVRGDKIHGQRKFENARTFNNYARFVFASNRKKFGVVQEDTFDRALFIIRPHDEGSKGLGPREWLAWRDSLKPFFDSFDALLKHDDAREHLMSLIMSLDPARAEVESTEFSSGFDEDMARSNLSAVSRIIIDLIEDCCLAGYDEHIDGVFTKPACLTRITELVKTLGYNTAPGRVFETMREQRLIEKVANGNWRTTQKIGSLAETYSTITGVKVIPKLPLTAADFGPNDNEIKLPPKTRKF